MALSMHIFYRSDFAVSSEPEVANFFNDLVIAAGKAETYEEADNFDEITIWFEPNMVEIE